MFSEILLSKLKLKPKLSCRLKQKEKKKKTRFLKLALNNTKAKIFLWIETKKSNQKINI